MMKDADLQLTRRALVLAAPALAVLSALARAASKSDAPDALARYEEATGGHIGLYAENLATGAKLEWRADERFVMCSTFKSSLAALVLSRVDRRRDRLDSPIHFGPADIIDDWWAPVAKANLSKGVLSLSEMCAAAVRYSDNTCANLVLARIGGPAALTTFWRATGDRVTRLDHNEPALNRSPPGDPHDTTTPRAMAGNLRRFLLGNVLSPASRTLLTGWMLEGKTGDNRIRAGVPAGWRVADKTGNNGRDAGADIAIVWPKPGVPIIVAAYAQGGSPTAAQLDGILAEIGRLLGQRLG